jgi:hypothetical protein
VGKQNTPPIAPGGVLEVASLVVVDFKNSNGIWLRIAVSEQSLTIINYTTVFVAYSYEFHKNQSKLFYSF